MSEDRKLSSYVPPIVRYELPLARNMRLKSIGRSRIPSEPLEVEPLSSGSKVHEVKLEQWRRRPLGPRRPVLNLTEVDQHNLSIEIVSGRGDDLDSICSILEFYRYTQEKKVHCFEPLYYYRRDVIIEVSPEKAELILKSACENVGVCAVFLDDCKPLIIVMDSITDFSDIIKNQRPVLFFLTMPTIFSDTDFIDLDHVSFTPLGKRFEVGTIIRMNREATQWYSYTKEGSEGKIVKDLGDGDYAVLFTKITGGEIKLPVEYDVSRICMEMICAEKLPTEL